MFNTQQSACWPFSFYPFICFCLIFLQFLLQHISSLLTSNKTQMKVTYHRHLLLACCPNITTIQCLRGTCPEILQALMCNLTGSPNTHISTFFHSVFNFSIYTDLSWKSLWLCQITSPLIPTVPTYHSCSPVFVWVITWLFCISDGMLP